MMTYSEFYAFLHQHDHAVLATVSPAGTPEAALVGFAVNEALELVFDTSKLSRKFANLMACPAVALVIGWEDDVTLQYEGEASALAATELDAFKALYFARFPAGRERESWPDIAYIVVRPRWVRYSDFRPTPPLIIEMSLEA